MTDPTSPAVAGTEDGMGAGAGPRLHIAVVHTAREVSCVIAAASRGVLERRLADYVRQRARWQLWPDTARHVDALFADGDASGAIRLYFDATGERWDEERLCLEVVDVLLDSRTGGSWSLDVTHEAEEKDGVPAGSA